MFRANFADRSVRATLVTAAGARLRGRGCTWRWLGEGEHDVDLLGGGVGGDHLKRAVPAGLGPSC